MKVIKKREDKKINRQAKPACVSSIKLPTCPRCPAGRVMRNRMLKILGRR
jgi:hypothetical protein